QYQGTAAGVHDLVGVDPLFIFPEGADFHLQAFPGGSTSPAVDAGDFNTDSGLAATLTPLSTASDGTRDSPPIDLGYHYGGVAPTPTPPPRSTRTAARGTPTRTATPSGSTPTPVAPVGARTARPTKTPRG